MEEFHGREAIETLLDANSSAIDLFNALKKIINLRKLLLEEDLFILEGIIDPKEFVKSIRDLLASHSTSLRTLSYRTLTYFCINRKIAVSIFSSKVDFFMSRTVEVSSKLTQERLEAFRLMKKLVRHHCDIVTTSIVQTILSIGRIPKDPLCLQCSETAAEIGLFNPELATGTGIIKFLRGSLLVSHYSPLQKPIIDVLLYLLDHPDYRKHCSPLDFEVMLGPLIESYMTKATKNEATIVADSIDKWRKCSDVVIDMLRSWTGFITLTSHPRGLQTIVNALKFPNLSLRKFIVESLFEIFHIPLPHHENLFHVSKEEEEIGASKDKITEIELSLPPPRNTKSEHNLLNSYIGAMILAFIDCGLIEALIKSGNEFTNDESGIGPTGIPIHTAVTVLLGELLYLSDMLLPKIHSASISQLHSLVKDAVSSDVDPQTRSRSSTMIIKLNKFTNSKEARKNIKINYDRETDARVARVETVKRRILIDVESKVNDTKVMSIKAKYYKQWKWERIVELLEGPLSDPNVNIDIELLANFLTRIITVYLPSEGKFPNISNSRRTTHRKNNVDIYCVALVRIVETAMVHNMGFVLENLIEQIAEKFKIEAEDCSTNNEESYLSKTNLLKTLRVKYFLVIRILSRSMKGIDLLDSYNFFNILHKTISRLQDRADFMRYVLYCLDYSQSDQTRKILADFLVCDSVLIRELAAKHLLYLYRKGIPDFHTWGIPLLSESVGKIGKSLQIIDETTEDPKCLEMIIETAPFDLLSVEIKTSFLSSENGFESLKRSNFIFHQLEYWMGSPDNLYIDSGNTLYAEKIESELSKALNTSLSPINRGVSSFSYSYTMPKVFIRKHFIGELAKTKQGCIVIEKEGVLYSLMQLIENEYWINGEVIPIIVRRGAIWAAGHIVSSERGYNNLRNIAESVVQLIFDTCNNSPILSLRGTAFYVLGLMTNIPDIREFISKRGWSTTDSQKICLPNDASKGFYHINDVSYDAIFKPYEEISPQIPLNPSTIEEKIISLIGALCNNISGDIKSQRLKDVKTRHPEYFSDPRIFWKAAKNLKFKMKLKYRRLLYNEIFAGVDLVSLISVIDEEEKDNKM
eukprot:TRINITY_DN6264_c0_g1_i1.p1 TRINITY_DN6264_c0_g1~~TRINITY_DN6264_c0_g1_i1.p1  ORF type:complete len:1092 (-),score=205.67 TRINITY_DN6264_c0_g1_i1:14-3289(-)